MNVITQDASAREFAGAHVPFDASWVKDYLPRLEIMGVQLTETSAQVEEAVVQICRDFQEIAARTLTTVHRTTDFLGRENNLGQRQSFNGLIQNCGLLLVKSLKTASDASEASKQAIERVQKMDEASQQISSAMIKLEEISSGNKILALNARIEAVRSGVQAGGFEAVAVELRAQTEKSMAVTAHVGELGETLRFLAESTTNDLRILQAQAEMRIEASRTEINEALESLRGAHDQMKSMMSEITEDGRKLAIDIQSAVRGLQFQDAVSQRLAHVVEDLGIVSAKLAAGADGIAPLEPFNESVFSAYTMRAERAAAMQIDTEATGGDVELF